MEERQPRPQPRVWLPKPRLQDLIDALRERGYRVVGPVPREGAVVYDEIERVDELPVGWRETQEPGSYRIERSGGDAVFDVVNGPGSLKRFFFAPREELLQIELEEGGAFRVEETLPAPPPTAFLGVRACDLAALGVQDRIFLYDRYPDPYYAARRKGVLLVAVSCTRSAATCFCASMETGPEPRSGFDLALTEQADGFVARAGSREGASVLEALDLETATAECVRHEEEALRRCAEGMQRSMKTSDLPDLLYRNLEHPRWDDVAERCLSCANCTMVCPTCFCHDERDEPSPDGLRSLRVREWDSCFSREHAHVHGKNYRPHIRQRYRQWLVHKVASWIDQYGVSGCVGCGRCITWCPVGIDLTEEVAAIREEPG
jgi:sulfhydrogenase subunit beta (sulfur reductase)